MLERIRSATGRSSSPAPAGRSEHPRVPIDGNVQPFGDFADLMARSDLATGTLHAAALRIESEIARDLRPR